MKRWSISMKQDNSIIGILIEDTTLISLNEVCQRYRISEDLLLEMLEYGIFSSKSSEIEQLKLTQKDLYKMESAFRLHRDLELNLTGVALDLELLEKIDRLNDELNILRKHF